MSGILVLPQRNAVHLMADAASYDRATGELHSINLTKCYAMPTLPAAISCTGPAEFGALFAYEMTQRFETFDEIVATGEEELPKIFNKWSALTRDGDAASTFYIIGWMQLTDRPAAYAVDLWTDKSSRIEQIAANTRNSGAKLVGRNVLKRQMGLAGTPLPGMDLVRAAGFVVQDNEDDHNAEIDLLHLMEVMRHEEIEGHHWIGGKAMLTTIDRNGITQRVVHHWKEDEVGEPIRPLPIDWKAWRAERTGETVVDVTAGMSRLQREMYVKRQAKLAKRRSAA